MKHALILTNNWQYPANRTEITAQLMLEQHQFCAYWEIFIGNRGDSKDIEHLNPKLKNTENDGYDNWGFVQSSIEYGKRKHSALGKTSANFIAN